MQPENENLPMLSCNPCKPYVLSASICDLRLCLVYGMRMHFCLHRESLEQFRLLEVVLAKLPITTVAAQTFDASICGFLTGIIIFAELFAVGGNC